MSICKSVVFYSFKGGTGRSLALANIANNLASLKHKICIVDMDLEAPGVHYKLLSIDDSRIDTMLGIVDYIDYFNNLGMTPDIIDDYYIDVNDFISIIPSGNIRSDEYWYKLSNINWHQLLYSEDPIGIKLFVDLINRIKSDKREFEYILIDSRAGITPLSGICTTLLGDALAVFFTASSESIDGTRQMIKRIVATRKSDDSQAIPIVAVLTRFEKFGNDDDERIFLSDIKNQFIKEIDNNVIDMHVIHSDREIERNEFVILGDIKQIHYDAIITSEYLGLFNIIVRNLESNAAVNLDILEYESPLSDLGEEIFRFENALEDYGLNLDMLSKYAPRRKSMRKSYVKIVNIISEDTELLHRVYINHEYPEYRIAKLTGFSLNRVSKARTFVTASLIIMNGDYPILSSYI